MCERNVFKLKSHFFDVIFLISSIELICHKYIRIH